MQKRLFALIATLILFNTQTPQAAQLLFTPELVLTEEYTDNLFLTQENEENDTITTAGVNLKTQALWRSAGMELNYNPTYNAYAENDDLNYWRHSAVFHTWKDFKGGTRLELHDTYLRTHDPIDESARNIQEGQSLEPVIGSDPNRRGRNEYYTNVGQFRVSHPLGVDGSFYAAYQYRTLREVDPLPGVAVDDNDSSSPSLGLIYHFTQQSGLDLNGSFTDTDYEEHNDRSQYDGNLRLFHDFTRSFTGFIEYRHTQLDYDQDTDEDYQIYQPSIGFRYEFSKNSGFEISAAYYYQDFETSEDDEGYNINSKFNTRWDYRTGYLTIVGGSGYDIDSYGAEDNGLNLYANMRIEAGHHFTQQLLGMIYGAYRYDDYPNETPERVRHTTRTGVALRWQALQWMQLALSYDFSDVNSDLETEEYTENRGMLTIKLAPATPFRLN